MAKNGVKGFLQRLRKTNVEVFDTDKRLDYRVVHKERLEKAKEDRWPLD